MFLLFTEKFKAASVWRPQFFFYGSSFCTYANLVCKVGYLSMSPIQISFKPFEEMIMSASDFSFTREIRSGERWLSCLILVKSSSICSNLYEGESMCFWKTRSLIWFWLCLIIQGISCYSISTRSHVSTNSSDILKSSEEESCLNKAALGLDEVLIISSTWSCSNPFDRL